MSCEAIRSRVIGPIPHPRLNFSIAFAKGVHTDYEFLEMGLATTYSPENHYCFAVDSKSTPEFQHRFRMLASCLPNVYLTPVKRSMTSAGAYVNRAHLDCLEVLIEQPGWEYVILQQTYDFLAHSNEELMMMLKKLNGYNDIFACQPEQMLAKRIDRSLNWTAAGLNLFTKSSPYTAEQKKAATIEFGYGYVQATLGRKAVKWMTQDVNLTTLIDHLTHNKTGYGVDEQFIATLALSETLLMPGGLHHRCGGKPGFGYFTRYTIWKGDCKTRKWRKGQCIWGVEDLPMLRNISSRYLMINKFLPDFDFLGIHCLSESIYNRTHMGPDFVNLELLGKHAIVDVEGAPEYPGYNQCPLNTPKTPPGLTVLNP
ncbi:unnamed protein product, partial [Mesorhabditis spiculigera]